MKRIGSVSIWLLAMFSVYPARADLVDFDVRAGMNLVAFEGQPVIFAGFAADPDSGIATVEWDFNYDATTFVPDAAANGTLMPVHTFMEPGMYNVALEATNNNGLSMLSTLDVTVAEAQGFVVEAGPSRTGPVDQPILFAGFAADQASGITSIQWDFDYDGTHFVPNPSDDGELTPSNVFHTPGTYEVAMKATDGLGVSEIATTSAVVMPEPKFLGLSVLLLGPVVLRRKLRTSCQR